MIFQNNVHNPPSIKEENVFFCRLIFINYLVGFNKTCCEMEKKREAEKAVIEL